MDGIGELTSDQYEALRPYLTNRPAREGKNGPEWALHCPLHEDERPSAELNPVKRVWNCHGCGAGGSVSDLMVRQGDWVLAPPDAGVDAPPVSNGGGAEPLRLGAVKYHNEQMTKPQSEEVLAARQWLLEARGISRRTIRKFMLGYDEYRHCYSIPVFSPDQTLLNVRRYTPRPNAGYAKMLNVAGHGDPTLYPAWLLHELKPGDRAILGEGEWDCLLTRQHSHKVFVVTGAVKTAWRTEWSECFRDVHVFLMHDCDKAGQEAAAMRAAALAPYAASVTNVILPYPIEPDHGKDLTDFWLDRVKEEDQGEAEFEALLTSAPPPPEVKTTVKVGTLRDACEPEYENIPQLVPHISLRHAAAQKFNVPRRVRISCRREEGERCPNCPGDEVMHHVFEANDPRLAKFVRLDEDKQRAVLREELELPPKCRALRIAEQKHHAAQEIRVYDRRDPGKFEAEAVLVGSDSMPMPQDEECDIEGLYVNLPAHRSQMAFMVYRTEPSRRKSVGAPAPSGLDRLRPREGQAPLARCMQLANSMAVRETFIFGQTEMHVLMDLLFHSVLRYETPDFRGYGTLDAMLLGPTRCGKTEVATRYLDYYGIGGMTTGERASAAGLLGSSHQVNGAWTAVPGFIPRLHEEVAVIDEANKLGDRDALTDLGAMRSGKEVIIEKAGSARFRANVRLLMIANPPPAEQHRPMASVLCALFPAASDVARFDVVAGVPAIEDIFGAQRRMRRNMRPVPQELARELLQWCWDREPDQIIITNPAGLKRQARALSQQYDSDAPALLDHRSTKNKLCRLAIAMAARTFSTDRSRKCIVVKPEHVAGAATFLRALYDAPHFGFLEIAEERRRQDARAHTLVAKFKDWPDAPRFARWLVSNQGYDYHTTMNIWGSFGNIILEMIRDGLLVPDESRNRDRNKRITQPLQDAFRKAGLL